VKRINRVLHEDDPAQEVLPDTKEAIAQYLLLFSMAAKPRDLNNFVDYPFRQANVYLQLKTWDADAMQRVLERVKDYQASHPLPGVTFKPAGIAYFNKVWNDEVLWGMLHGFLWSAVLVGGLMCLAFRSLRWGLVAILPLLFTVALSAPSAPKRYPVVRPMSTRLSKSFLGCPVNSHLQPNGTELSRRERAQRAKRSAESTC